MSTPFLFTLVLVWQPSHFFSKHLCDLIHHFPVSPVGKQKTSRQLKKDIEDRNRKRKYLSWKNICESKNCFEIAQTETFHFQNILKSNGQINLMSLVTFFVSYSIVLYSIVFVWGWGCCRWCLFLCWCLLGCFELSCFCPVLR